VDWSTSLSLNPPSSGDASNNVPDQQQLEDNFVKIKESATEDVYALRKAVEAAAGSLDKLSSASLQDTVERTWELLGGLKDLEGAATSLREILEGLPLTEDGAVGALVEEVVRLQGRLVEVTRAAAGLNETAKVNRSVESKRSGGRLVFGCGPHIALLHLLSSSLSSSSPSSPSAKNKGHGQRS